MAIKHDAAMSTEAFVAALRRLAGKPMPPYPLTEKQQRRDQIAMAMRLTTRSFLHACTATPPGEPIGCADRPGSLRYWMAGATNTAVEFRMDRDFLKEGWFDRGPSGEARLHDPLGPHLYEIATYDQEDVLTAAVCYKQFGSWSHPQEFIGLDLSRLLAVILGRTYYDEETPRGPRRCRATELHEKVAQVASCPTYLLRGCSKEAVSTHSVTVPEVYRDKTRALLGRAVTDVCPVDAWREEQGDRASVKLRLDLKHLIGSDAAGMRFKRERHQLPPQRVWSFNVEIV